MNPYLQVISINMKMALCIESKITFAEAVNKTARKTKSSTRSSCSNFGNEFLNCKQM